jgi:hypothetical protein
LNVKPSGAAPDFTGMHAGIEAALDLPMSLVDFARRGKKFQERFAKRSWKFAFCAETKT